ncbi:MAG: PilT/PilU family type 4a pilus ATPase [Armatimonadetes bacterium]|nr:PilT/PilU family type 4a pilus ATPase [Armatimonadota bacterium]
MEQTVSMPSSVAVKDPKTVTFNELVLSVLEQKGSDLFLKGGQVPMMKQFSEIKPVSPEFPVLSDEVAGKLISGLMDERMKAEFEQYYEFDLGLMVDGRCRVRTNIYFERGHYALVSRIVPLEIPSLEGLGLPPVLEEVTKYKQGLVLVTGPTGCGKTTTLAALLDIINRTRKGHIVTVEDPLEFVHPDKNCYVSQRELGIDTKHFQHALRAMLRQAPDVILIGEMRDSETMGIALQAGETGHLVFSTVHTASAYETMDRIVNMFPPHEKHHISQRMANSLKAIIAQKLVPRCDKPGRVAANEILICTPTVCKLIEDSHFSDLYHAMNEGEFWGMQTMNQSLLRYYKAGIVSEEMALLYAGVSSELKQMMRR